MMTEPMAFHASQDPDVSGSITAPLGAQTNGMSNGILQAKPIVAPTLTASNDPSRSPQSSEVTKQVEAVFYASSMAVRRPTPTECEPAVAVDSYNLRETGDISQTIKSPQGGVTESVGAVRVGMAVRRLTPTECERLQGFPDGYTDIKSPTPDGPRYKALGNSMAVPVMRWIGGRINKYEQESDIAGL